MYVTSTSVVDRHKKRLAKQRTRVVAVDRGCMLWSHIIAVVYRRRLLIVESCRGRSSWLLRVVDQHGR